jgi:protein O-GlcNAc transferase
MDIGEMLQAAFDYYRKGDMQQAETIFREVIHVHPQNADALHFIGLISFRHKKYDAAIEHIRRAIELNPNCADAYNNLGIIYQTVGHHNEAIRHYRKALQIEPGSVNAYYNLGIALQSEGQTDEALLCFKKTIELNPCIAGPFYYAGLILHQKGQMEEALASFLKSVELDPNLSGAYYMIAIIFHAQGQIVEAIGYYQQAIEHYPDNVDAYNNLGVALQSQERFEEAKICFNKAIALHPDYAQAYNNLGNTLKELGDWDASIASFKRAIEIKPDYTLAYYNMGNVLGYQGKVNEAINAYDRALEIKPDFVSAQWARCMSRLPFVYPDKESIKSVRNRYRSEMLNLIETVPLSSAKSIEEAALAVGSHQPFLLACQGLNDRDLQEMYGGLVCRIMEKRYPHYATSPEMHPGIPLRIGILSAYFHLHSVWKIPIRGWLENIDKTKFQIYGYHTGRTKDNCTEAARRLCFRFTEDTQSFEELCGIIRKDNLHILIYPEIGMDPVTVKLAALRLAPVQCVSWGHPDTSGLPTIDYYLSSDLMEPDDADDHYSERLVRLPNLSVCYAPVEIAPFHIKREIFNLRPDSLLYLCSQSLFKYLPQHDDIFPRIAKRAGDCQFLFISEISSCVTEQFRSRVTAAFDHFGMRADDHIVFLPRLDSGKFLGVNLLSDVFLDSIDWSGCNSTFEALGCNLPVVTLPGKLMRGRHSMAILAMMGLREMIATSADEYIDIAVRLGKDAAWRRQISEKIDRNKHLVYHDSTPVVALEKFLEETIANRTSEIKHGHG